MLQNLLKILQFQYFAMAGIDRNVPA